MTIKTQNTPWGEQFILELTPRSVPCRNTSFGFEDLKDTRKEEAVDWQASFIFALIALPFAWAFICALFLL